MSGAIDTNGAADSARHVPVMLEEVLHFLAPSRGGIIIDGTFGAGGYTRALLSAGADVLAIDRDPDAIARGGRLVAKANGRLCLVHGRFSELDVHARGVGRQGVDGVVLDIGVSSMQLDEADRGFSFRLDGPLDMRMERTGPSAADVVNEMGERDLAVLISMFGEERKAGLVARAIVNRRVERRFETTGDLADVVGRAIGRRHDDTIDPATRTFQALRIYVNRELDELAAALAAAERILAPGGRLVVVSFHSLEDRIVKRFLADRSRTNPGGSRHLPQETLPPATFTLLAKGAETPGETETGSNPRARSARLRAAVRTEAAARDIDMAALGVPQLEARRRR
ncbi:MAG: 16S rRNA (cytosine(1402)-N(4))-methyltransferase RsmH [Hyphomicrobiales bacterium]